MATQTMSAEETQNLLRNLAASTSKSVLESLEAAKKAGIPLAEMRSAISKAMSENFLKPLTKDILAVKEYAADPTETTRKYTRLRTAEGEYRSAAEVLQEAKLLDHTNRWIDNKEPDPASLTPEQKRAVARFKSAEENAIRLGIIDGEIESRMSMRALRTVMRAPVEFDIKLLTVLAGAPVAIAAVIAYQALLAGLGVAAITKSVCSSTTETLNSPEVMEGNNLLEGPRYTALLEWINEADTTLNQIETNERRLIPYNTPDIEDIILLSSPPVLEAEIVEMELRENLVDIELDYGKSAISSPADLKSALSAAKVDAVTPTPEVVRTAKILTI